MTQIIDNLVKELNTYIISSRQATLNMDNSFIVFGATVEENSQFKAYKRVTYKLVFVHPKGKNQEIYSDSVSGNFSVESDKKRVYESLNHNIINKIFYMLQHDSDKLLKGDFS